MSRAHALALRHVTRPVPIGHTVGFMVSDDWRGAYEGDPMVDDEPEGKVHNSSLSKAVVGDANRSEPQMAAPDG